MQKILQKYPRRSPMPVTSELNKNKFTAQESSKTLKRNSGTTAPKNGSQWLL